MPQHFPKHPLSAERSRVSRHCAAKKATWPNGASGGAFLLAENHCPICIAARACQGFCRSELEVFKAALGPEATVERTDHIIAGARRCAYRIAPR